MTTPAYAVSADTTLPARRRSELIRLARLRGQVTVTELAPFFDVSPDTIRRDLDYLASRGLVVRTHGGAMPVDSYVNSGVPFAQRVNTRTDAKTRIGRAAAGMIADGETLIVNGGSTTRAFVGELGMRRNLTIVTNNLGIPTAVPPQALRDIYILGGQLRPDALVTIGAVGFAKTGPINVDTSVLGVGGVAASAGLTTTMLEEASMIADMIAAARRTIIMADSTKFGHSAFAHIAPLDRIHMLVTDAPPPPDLAEALERAGVELVVAGAD